jgi:hypothetical protein
MREIETMAGLPVDAARRLRKAGIETVDDLWSRLGARKSQDDFDLQFVSIVDISGISSSQLLSLLADEAVFEVRWGDYARLKSSSGGALAHWVWSGLKDVGTELREVLQQSPRVLLGRQWLDVVVAAVVVLGLWMFVANRLLPVFAAEREPSLIARHDLGSGQMLGPEDWVQSRWLPVSGDRLDVTSNPADWRTTSKIAGGQPLGYSDLERRQVVAARDLAAGEILSSGSVELEFSAVSPDAFLTGEGLVDTKTRWKILAGTVITSDLLDPAPPRVVAAGWLPAFHVLRLSDVVAEPNSPSAVGLVQQVLGGLTLRDLADGESVEGALLTLPFPEDELVDRRVIPVEALAAGFELRAGSRVSLWISPAGDPAAAFELEGVLVLRAATGGEPTLVALTEEELGRLVPWLGRSKIVAYRLVSVP